MRIFGENHDVKAEVATIEGFSAHADQDELIEWFAALGGSPRRTHIVRGEEDASLALTDLLRERSGGDVKVPRLGQEFDHS